MLLPRPPTGEKTEGIAERRLRPRQGVPSFAYVDLHSGNGGILFDLSGAGMGISVAHPVAVNQQIRFAIKLEAGAYIHGSGQVVWTNESGKSAGVRFQELPEGFNRQVMLLLSSQQRSSGARGIQIQAQPEEARVPEYAPPQSQEKDFSSLPDPSGPPKTKEPTRLVNYPDPSRHPSEFFRPADPPLAPREVRETDDESELLPTLRFSASRSLAELTAQLKQRHRKAVLVGIYSCVALITLTAGVSFLLTHKAAMSVAFRDLRLRLASTVGLTLGGNQPVPTTTPPASKARSGKRGASRSQPKQQARDAAAGGKVSTTEEGKGAISAVTSQFDVVGLERRRRLEASRTTTVVPFEGPDRAQPRGTQAGLSAGASSPGMAMVPASDSARGGTPDKQDNPGSATAPLIMPTYAPLDLNPESAATGVVLLEAVIAQDGSVQKVDLIGPSSALASEVKEAVKHWRYRPFLRNGRPTEVVVRIKIDFSVPALPPE